MCGKAVPFRKQAIPFSKMRGEVPGTELSPRTKQRVPTTVRRSLTSLQAAKPQRICLQMPDEDKEDTNRRSGIAYAAAFSLFAAVVSGLLLGWLLDRWLGTKPWLLVAGLTLGSIAGFYEFIRSTSRLS